MRAHDDENGQLGYDLRRYRRRPHGRYQRFDGDWSKYQQHIHQSKHITTDAFRASKPKDRK